VTTGAGSSSAGPTGVACAKNPTSRAAQASYRWRGGKEPSRAAAPPGSAERSGGRSVKSRDTQRSQRPTVFHTAAAWTARRVCAARWRELPGRLEAEQRSVS
jgi:hypothetical protein